MFGESVAAQILVLGAGPVNITNLAVDGTGGDMNCAGGGRGNLLRFGFVGSRQPLRPTNEVDRTCRVGIWAENANTSDESVTVRNSSVYNVDATGIFIGSGAPPSLAATIDNHVVNASAALAAVESDSVTGQVVADNIQQHFVWRLDTSGLNVPGNTIMGITYGIHLVGGAPERWATRYRARISLCLLEPIAQR